MLLIMKTEVVNLEVLNSSFRLKRRFSGTFLRDPDSPLSFTKSIQAGKFTGRFNGPYILFSKI